jgi:hypothetical protein
MHTTAANQTLGYEEALTLAKASDAYAEPASHPWLLVVLAALLCLEVIFALTKLMTIRLRYRGRERLVTDWEGKC